MKYEDISEPEYESQSSIHEEDSGSMSTPQKKKSSRAAKPDKRKDGNKMVGQKRPRSKVNKGKEEQGQANVKRFIDDQAIDEDDADYDSEDEDGNNRRKGFKNTENQYYDKELLTRKNNFDVNAY